jgi:hypothetical protein
VSRQRINDAISGDDLRPVRGTREQPQGTVCGAVPGTAHVPFAVAGTEITPFVRPQLTPSGVMLAAGRQRDDLKEPAGRRSH